MTKIVPFVPHSKATAEVNLLAFIETAKPLLKAYSEVASWEENNWDLRGVFLRTGIGDIRHGVVFTTFDGAKMAAPRGAKKVDAGWMSEPFLSFAKAYFLYIRALVGLSKPFNVIAALRALEKALNELHGSSDVYRVTPLVCDHAARLVQDGYKRKTAYTVGGCLERLATFISDNRLANPFQWKSGIRRPQEQRNRVGMKADEARAAKMPSQAALDALPHCFNMAVDVSDVLGSSVAALLCAAPARIGEVFALRVDCEVQDVLKGKPIYGLRWFPEKGVEPTVKWIAPTMVEVAKAAIAKLRAISQPAREIAAWYEDHPGQIYLPSGTEHLRSKEFLVGEEVAKILGLSKGIKAGGWLQEQGVMRFDPWPGTRAYRYRFDQFEAAVLAKLPKGFPIIDERTGLKYSEALLVVRQNELHAQRGTILCLVEPVTTNRVNEALGSGVDRQSMFERLGFTEPDGRKIQVTTHQFRHWLNTLAHRGGMSQLDIAKWSGRKDVRQNQAYDHMAPEEFLSMARELTEGDDRLFGGLAELTSKTPVSRDEFMMLVFPTAHVTELGFCVHDFTMLPCERHRDCMNCNEHVCVKGDKSKTARIKEQLALAEAQLRKAEEAMADGYYGADRWQDHHRATVDRLRNLVNILEDTAVPDGSLIRLTKNNEFSPIRLAIQDSMRLEGPDSSTFNDLRAMLGGE